MNSPPRFRDDPGLALWPAPGKTAGLACGWEGYAWTVAHLVASGACTRPTRGQIRRFALIELAPNSQGGQLSGAGGVAVVCGLYASFDGSLRHWCSGPCAVGNTWASCPSSDLAQGTAGALLAAPRWTGWVPAFCPPGPAAARDLRARFAQSWSQLGRPRESGLLHGIAGLLLALIVGHSC
jgi:hypothetical protein